MIEILFLILKIIGIILASVLGLLLICLLAVLFLPIRYSVTAEVYDTKESVKASGTCRWLFGIIKMTFDFRYPDFCWNARILFINLNKILEKSQLKEEEHIVEKKSEAKQADYQGKIENNYNEKASQAIEESAPEKKTPFSKKIKFTIKRIYDSIRVMRERKDKLIDFLYDDVHQYTLEKCKQKLIYLLKKYKPDKVQLCGAIGFDDPSITGKMLAILGILYPIYGEAIEVTPEFEEKTMQLDGIVKGKIFIYPLVKIGISLISDKKVRRTISDVKNMEL